MLKGNLFAGLGLISEAFRRVASPGLRRYIMVPLLINIAVFSSLGWLFYSYTDDGVNWALSFLPDWLLWLKYLIMPAIILVFMLGVFFLFNFVANLIAAPFNGLLAEKVARQESSDITPIDETVTQLVLRTLAREWQKFKYYLPRVLALTLLSWIPVINLIAPVLWFFFTAWMVAFQYIDFAADSQGKSAAEVRQFMAQKRLTTLSLGAVIMICLTIPVLNFVVIPVAVIAATLYWQRAQMLPGDIQPLSQ